MKTREKKIVRNRENEDPSEKKMFAVRTATIISIHSSLYDKLKAWPIEIIKNPNYYNNRHIFSLIVKGIADRNKKPPLLLQ